jgi:hypothetical protein
MGFFCTYGSASLGVHSDLESSKSAAFHLRSQYVEREREYPHGPVRVLVKDGRRLRKPQIIPVRQPAA